MYSTTQLRTLNSPRLNIELVFPMACKNLLDLNTKVKVDQRLYQ